ncbi:hypothetical protein [Nonomuraea helvata]|uniref:Uncharacterized protein n=1 Tax=Nonomuraea helvata TaxID=37484 RepID=A0ABV5SI29_9ACTN
MSDDGDQPTHEPLTLHLGDLRPARCVRCGADEQFVAATIYGLAGSGSRVIGGMAVCQSCGWSPYTAMTLP